MSVPSSLCFDRSVASKLLEDKTLLDPEPDCKSSGDQHRVSERFLKNKNNILIYFPLVFEPFNETQIHFHSFVNKHEDLKYIHLN